MLHVYNDKKRVGFLERYGLSGTKFTYAKNLKSTDMISLIMPVRAKPYLFEAGLMPIFDAGLPEGWLKESISTTLRREGRDSDDFEILSYVGGNMIGRLSVLPEGSSPEAYDPEIDQKKGMVAPGEATSSNIAQAMSHDGLPSGISGMLPKMILKENMDISPAFNEGRKGRIRGGDAIIKMGDPTRPGILLNEFHCLKASQRSGNIVAHAHISEAFDILTVDRFDRKEGAKIGFEDFAALTGLTSQKKFSGSFEKSLVDVVRAATRKNKSCLENVFRQITTSIALRNGESHLKNFGLLYESPEPSYIFLAPNYDVVTTSVYSKNTLMALSLFGSRKWPSPDRLIDLAAHCGIPRERANEIIDEISEGILKSIPDMRGDFENANLPKIGESIEAQWKVGIANSLGRDVRINNEYDYVDAIRP